MTLNQRTSRAQRRAGAAVAVTAALALTAGAANAVVQDISTTLLQGHQRTWDLQSSGFGISDGSMTYNRTGSDAFDGGLILNVDGTAFSDSDGMGDYDATNQSIKVGPESLSGLDVSRFEKAKGAWDRSLVRLHNPTGSAITTTLQWYSNLGSDSAGVVQSTSTGTSSTWGKDDRWMVTSEPGATADGDDPVLAFVLAGKGAANTPTQIVDRPTSGSATLEYSVKVPAGQTRYLLFYTEMWDTPKHAKAGMAKYDERSLSSGLLAGISDKVRGQIVNWSL